jgi:glycosyltransferase involved in cell wall biosynthesis
MNIREDGKCVTESSEFTTAEPVKGIAVSLLTGGSDRPYVYGLATSLLSKGVTLDLIGSDELDFPEFRERSGLNFLNLRGGNPPNVSFARKILRVLTYYARLICYAATSKPRIFHILWNNKFEYFDRTVLMLYYRILAKKVVLTAHNVNADRRDSRDSFLNRITLRIQYHLSHQIFVHTAKMKSELIEQFGVRDASITVIPFGINNAVPNTSLTPSEAKRRLGLCEDQRAILFFGRITPYKGLEYLIAAFRQAASSRKDYRLIIAGRPDRCEQYWSALRRDIHEEVRSGQILLRADFIPDEEAEVYFKAADVLVLPYKDIYQSGVLFTGYNFGLPVIAADVGSLRDEIVECRTGFVFKPEDPADLARVIEQYFSSDLYTDLSSRRREISDFVTERHSWDVVGQMTTSVYAGLLQMTSFKKSLDCDASSASLHVKSPSQ